MKARDTSHPEHLSGAEALLTVPGKVLPWCGHVARPIEQLLCSNDCGSQLRCREELGFCGDAGTGQVLHAEKLLYFSFDA